MSGEGIKVQEKFYYLRFPAKPVSTNEIKDHYLGGMACRMEYLMVFLNLGAKEICSYIT